MIPGFVGVGVLLNGLLGGEDTRQAVSGGIWLILISLVLFATVGSLFGALEIGGRYWPVLLIALGLLAFAKESTQRGSIIGPVILIGLGTVLLLNNLGYFSWSIWEVVLLLWPILLVAAGLDILIGRRSALGSLLAMVVTLALMVWVLWLFGANLGTSGIASGAKIEQSLDGATQAEIFINPAVGRLHVEALPESANLVEGTIPPGIQDNVKRDFNVEGETAVLALQLQGATLGPFLSGGGGRGIWSIGVNPEIPTQLKLELGAGESEIDLTGLRVRDVRMSMGVGQTTVILPDKGDFKAKIEGAVGQTTVIIPEGTAVRIRLDTGIAGRQIPDTYERHDDIYISPGYESADSRIELEVSQAIGNMTIRHPDTR